MFFPPHCFRTYLKIHFHYLSAPVVIPAQAGIHVQRLKWTPAFARVTDSSRNYLFWNLFYYTVSRIPS